MLPLVGISVGKSVAVDSTENLSLKPLYADAVGAAGGAAVLIPLEQDEKALRGIYERLDAILFSGGGDIEPARYNAVPTGHLIEVDPLRDQVELTLMQWAIEDDKPVLGICRGHQVLNVALGGSLYQDLPTERGGNIQHDQKAPGEAAHVAHEVMLERQSLLQKAIDWQDATLPVNSRHHQAIKDIAPGLEAISYSSDGVIESVELVGKRFVLGVQWHPEGLYQTYSPHHSLFKAFVASAVK